MGTSFYGDIGIDDDVASDRVGYTLEKFDSALVLLKIANRTTQPTPRRYRHDPTMMEDEWRVLLAAYELVCERRCRVWHREEFASLLWARLEAGFQTRQWGRCAEQAWARLWYHRLLLAAGKEVGEAGKLTGGWLADELERHPVPSLPTTPAQPPRVTTYRELRRRLALPIRTLSKALEVRFSDVRNADSQSILTPNPILSLAYGQLLDHHRALLEGS